MSGKILVPFLRFLACDAYKPYSCFEWSVQFWVNFSGLVSWTDFIFCILLLLNSINDLAIISLMLDHSKIRKMHFWMIQRAKKEVFGHFLEFGLLNWLDIAYCDRTKCFPTFSYVTRSQRIIQRSQKCIFQWSKSPKKRFLAIFWTLVCQINLILHNVIVLNVFQHSTTLPDHEGSFKCHKNAFLNDSKEPKSGFWPFSGLRSVGST